MAWQLICRVSDNAVRPSYAGQIIARFQEGSFPTPQLARSILGLSFIFKGRRAAFNTVRYACSLEGLLWRKACLVRLLILLLLIITTCMCSRTMLMVNGLGRC